MPFASCRDIRIYYELRGRGPRLLFINGTGADLRRAPNAFERVLAEHFELLCFDQRGMGRSGSPDRACSMADFADDAAGLLDALGWDNTAVLGYSFGGMVAQELALRWPSRVARALLVSTTAGGAGGASYPLHEWSALPIEAQARKWVLQSDLRRDTAWQDSHAGLMQAMVDYQSAALQLATADQAARDGSRRQLEARRSHDCYDRLPELTMPVSVFAGRDDGLAPLAAQQAMAARIPGARLQVFDGGHLFFLRDAAASAAILAAVTGAYHPA